ncbi:MAG: hypothetical protein FWC09_10050 [Lachnospiraceae bacterium]|nr:hypothetical protein [Lachnospiraceae bacterium]
MAVRRMVRIALLSAILTIMKMAVPIPNVELVSLLIIIYTLLLGKESLFIITVFNFTELIIWGFGLWWISYLYVWPLLCVLVLLLKKVIKEEFLIWAVVAGMFGLIFGSLFAVIYLPVDPAYALAYWMAGLPWDVWHGVWNFVLMAVLGKPIFSVLKRVI